MQWVKNWRAVCFVCFRVRVAQVSDGGDGWLRVYRPCARSLAPSRRRRKRADNALSSALPPRSLAHYRPQLDGKCMRVCRLCLAVTLSVHPYRLGDESTQCALCWSFFPIQVSFTISYGLFALDCGVYAPMWTQLKASCMSILAWAARAISLKVDNLRVGLR